MKPARSIGKRPFAARLDAALSKVIAYDGIRHRIDGPSFDKLRMRSRGFLILSLSKDEETECTDAKCDRRERHSFSG